MSASELYPNPFLFSGTYGSLADMSLLSGKQAQFYECSVVASQIYFVDIPLHYNMLFSTAPEIAIYYIFNSSTYTEDPRSPSSSTLRNTPECIRLPNLPVVIPDTATRVKFVSATAGSFSFEFRILKTIGAQT